MNLQTDARWKNITFSPAKLTIGSFGCLIASVSHIAGQTPPETAGILDSNECFSSSGMLDSSCASRALGLEYGGKTTTPNANCIGETHYYAPMVSQHFFVIENGKQLDPLGKKDNYPIVSYRLFKRKEIKKESEVIMNPYENKDWFEAHKNGARGLYRKWLDREAESNEVVENWAKRNSDIGKIEDEFVRVAIGEWKERLKECENKPPVEKPVDVIVEKTVYKDRQVEIEHSWSEYIALGISKLLKLRKDI